jgi:hypothetical protein
MNATKKLICILAAGTTLGAAAPAFADSFHERGYDHNRHSAQYRDYDRRVYRDYDRHHFVMAQRPYVVQRPYIIERPVYYTQPAPMANMGMGAMIGATIGSIIDYRY